MNNRWLFPLFQFHKGSIKTNAHELLHVTLALFQFHKGSIKTILGF